MLHPTPVRKKEFHRLQHKIGLPYPNYGIDVDEFPILCRGYVDEGNFYVTHQQDISTVYRNGCFGHSSITERGPLSLMDSSYEKKFYYHKLKEKKKKLLQPDTQRRDNINLTEPNGSAKGPTYTSSSNGTKLVDEVEKLILLPEEVIFLSFGVGCLSIQNLRSSEFIGYRDIWKSLVRQNPMFPYFYAVYHYFRSKNWVPKPGIHYGGDYVLYQMGPEFYHSTYVVHIVGLPSRPKLTWNDLHAIERVAVTANKNVLLCEVEIPKDFLPMESLPGSIFDVVIRETVITRWTPFGPQPTQLED